MDLCIWFEDGTTAYFKDVTSFEEKDFFIIFKYISRSNAKSKKAKFYLDAIAGYSISTD